jgi:hypothetical protein
VLEWNAHAQLANWLEVEVALKTGCTPGKACGGRSADEFELGSECNPKRAGQAGSGRCTGDAGLQNDESGVAPAAKCPTQTGAPMQVLLAAAELSKLARNVSKSAARTKIS